VCVCVCVCVCVKINIMQVRQEVYQRIWKPDSKVLHFVYMTSTSLYSDNVKMLWM
jgi:hypothetical protein